MEKVDDGGPAFPGDTVCADCLGRMDGMSLLDYFAGVVLADAMMVFPGDSTAAVRRAYHIGDLMLRERRLVQRNPNPVDLGLIHGGGGDGEG